RSKKLERFFYLPFFNLKKAFLLTMKHILLPLFALFFLQINAQDSLDLSYYLPQDIKYDPNISAPQEILGYVPGEWHVSHDQLVSYMRTLTNESPRISIENRGTT